MGLFEKKKKVEEKTVEKKAKPSYVPRRLRRYYREASSSEERKMVEGILKTTARKETVELALQEVKKFKQKHSRLPAGREYDEIAENLFAQLKKGSFEEIEVQEGETPKERFEKRKMLRKEHEEREGKKGKQAASMQVEAKEKEAEAGKIEIPTEKALSLEGLGLEEEKKDKFLKLEELELAESSEGLKLEGMEDVENILKEVETEKNKCPNCSNKTEDLIFCPECGSAFCTHCAKRIQTINDKTSFVCPKCGKEFKMMKKTRI